MGVKPRDGEKTGAMAGSMCTPSSAMCHRLEKRRNDFKKEKD